MRLLCFEPVTEATEGVCKIPEKVILTCKGTKKEKPYITVEQGFSWEGGGGGGGGGGDP